MTKREEFTIGSGAEADLVLADASVSARHARLTVDHGGRVRIRDCDTAAGTYVLRNGDWRRLPTLAESEAAQHSEWAAYTGDVTEAHATVSLTETLRLGRVERSVADVITEIARRHPHLDELLPEHDAMRGRCPGCLDRRAFGQERCPRCGWASGRVPASAEDLLPGSSLDDGRLVGGAFARSETSTFYLGWDVRLDQRMCVLEFFPRREAGRDDGGAVLRPAAGAEEAFASAQARFESQLRGLLAQADVPDVCCPSALFRANATSYAIYPCQGALPLSIHSLIGDESLRLPWAEAWIRPLLFALRALHDRSVLHLGVHPTSVLLTPNGSRLVLGESVRAAGEKVPVPSDGAPPPQAAFAAPEQTSAAGLLGPWTDVYGAAATLFFAFTAAPPPEADRLEETLKTSDSLSWSEKHVFRKALAPRPEERLRSMAELEEWLFHPPRGPIIG
jgi:hypothetical protein